MEFLESGASFDRLREIVEMIDDVIWSMDASTLKTLYLSPSAERMYGRTIADLLVSETWTQFVPAEDFAAILSLCARVRAGDSGTVDFRAHHPVRGVRHVHMKEVVSEAVQEEHSSPLAPACRRRDERRCKFAVPLLR